MKKGGEIVLNEKKIKIMTDLVRYEKKENETNFNVINFYKSDYIRYHILKTFVSVTIAYLLMVVLGMLYQAEYLIANIVILDYKAIGTMIAGIYFLLLLLYEVITIIICVLRYEKAQKYVMQYYKILEILRRFYGSETEQK